MASMLLRVCRVLFAALLLTLLVRPGMSASTSPPAPSYVFDPPVNAAAPATVRQVTNRTGLAHILGSQTQQGGRLEMVSYVPVSAISVCVFNGYVSSTTSGVETTSGGTDSVRLVIEYPHGVFTPLTWSGNTTGSVAGNALACSDMTPLGFTIPPFTRFRLNDDHNFASGGNVVYSSFSNSLDRGNGDEFQVGSSGYGHTQDDTVLGSAGAFGINLNWFPALVLGLSDRQVVAEIGDSIFNGINDFATDPSGGRGFGGRSAALLGPQVNMGVNGDQALWESNASNTAIRQQVLVKSGATVALLETGVNDFFTGTATADQLLAYRAAIRSWMTATVPGIHIYDLTVTPDTNSTDYFQTTANQTPVTVNGSYRRTEFNDFLRGIGSGSYASTCTENASTSLTGCAGLLATSVAPGMYASGANIPTNDVVTGVNQATGAVTLTSAATASGSQTITFAWPTFATTWPLISKGATSATINAGGSGGTNGACAVTVSGGTDTLAATVNVTIASNAISAINSIGEVGSYTAPPANPAAVTGCSLSGASLNITWTQAQNAGLIDVARVVEGSPNQAASPITNGGAWLAGFTSGIDGLHPNSTAALTIQNMVSNSLSLNK